MTLGCNRSPYLFQPLVVFNSPSRDDVIYTTDFWSLTQILAEWHIIKCTHLSSSFASLPSFASFTNTSLVFHGQRVCPYSVVRAKRAVVSVHSLSDRLVLCGMICSGGGQAEKQCFQLGRLALSCLARLHASWLELFAHCFFPMCAEALGNCCLQVLLGSSHFTSRECVIVCSWSEQNRHNRQFHI